MRIYVARRVNRGAFYLPMAGTKENPNILFFLPQGKGQQISEGQLDELVRVQLEKQGVTKESDVHAIVEQAETTYEQRLKVAEAQAEVRRLMALKAAGARLMSVGFRKWRQAFYPGVKKGG